MKIIYSLHWKIKQNHLNMINELKKFWDLTVLVDTKQKQIEWVKFYMCKNIWFDLGKLNQYIRKHYKTMSKRDEFIYCNDSISILKSLWVLFTYFKQQDNGFYGACDAYTVHDILKEVNWYHIQSYFWNVKWSKAINILLKHYLDNKPCNNKDSTVINFECLINKKMIQAWVKVDAFIRSDDIMKKYWFFRSDFWCWAAWKTIHDPKWEFNWPFEHPKIYIEEGLPFCKNTCLQYHRYDETLLPYLANICLLRK